MLNHPDIATLLLQRGANAQYRQFGTGNVALHEAALNGNLECVQVIGFSKKKFQKSKFTMKVGGWVQVSLGFLLLVIMI